MFKTVTVFIENPFSRLNIQMISIKYVEADLNESR
jgi:hypothetical protein